MITDSVFETSKTITQYQIAEADDIPIDKLYTCHMGTMQIDVIDPVADYADLMEHLFDFVKIETLFSSGLLTMCFDAMHAVTGPYAHEILENRLGAPAGTVRNGTPSPDFGGGHPDPNPIWAKPLVDLVMGPDAPDFAAASDGEK